MDPVDAILADPEEPIVRIPTLSPEAAAALRKELRAKGWHVLWLDEHRPIADHDALMDACAEACAFPDYFGRNLNALKDCLADLPDVEHGYVLLLREPQLLQRNDPEAFAGLVEICETVDEIFFEKTSMRLKLALAGSVTPPPVAPASAR